MATQWTPIAVLALLSLVGKGAAHPTRRESTLGTPNTTNEHVVTSCPHIMKRLGTPKQFSGAWYPWEVIRHSAPPSAMPCVRFVFSEEDGRLNIRVEKLEEGAVVDSSNYSHTQNSNGLWEAEGLSVSNAYQLGFASDDSSVLVACSTSVAGASEHPWEDVETSMVLGRRPALDEAAVAAAVNRTALEAAQAVDDVVRVRPPLQHCTAPAPAP